MTARNLYADSHRGCNLPMSETELPDYYELLEISPQATQETIHRVYRYMAARYHPDIEGTGNLDKFTQLTSAYKVLSDPNARSEYNVQRATRQPAIRNLRLETSAPDVGAFCRPGI